MLAHKKWKHPWPAMPCTRKPGDGMPSCFQAFAQCTCGWTLPRAGEQLSAPPLLPLRQSMSESHPCWSARRNQHRDTTAPHPPSISPGTSSAPPSAARSRPVGGAMGTAEGAVSSWARAQRSDRLPARTCPNQTVSPHAALVPSPTTAVFFFSANISGLSASYIFFCASCSR